MLSSKIYHIIYALLWKTRTQSRDVSTIISTPLMSNQQHLVLLDLICLYFTDSTVYLQQCITRLCLYCGLGLFLYVREKRTRLNLIQFWTNGSQTKASLLAKRCQV